jgi:GNAT superfamily N-acetyltransferase
MPKSGLAAILRRLGSILITYVPQYLYREPLIKTSDLKSLPPEGLEFLPITYDNVELIREWKGPFYVRRFRALLNRGYFGLYGIMNGQVVSYQWIVVKLNAWSPACWHDPIEVGEAMAGRLETRPAYRRHGIGLHSRAKMQDLVSQHCGGRVKQTWGATTLSNKPMQELVSHLGFIRSKELHSVVILGHLYLSRVWDLVPNTSKRVGRGRWIVRIKVPDFLFSPGFRWLGLRPQRVMTFATDRAGISGPV